MGGAYRCGLINSALPLSPRRNIVICLFVCLFVCLFIYLFSPVNQIEIHPFLSWNDCVAYCQKEDIAVMAYSPLAKAEKLNNPSLCRIAKK